MGLTVIRRMLLPDHVGSRKPGEPATEGPWAKMLLTWANLTSFVLLLPQHGLLLPLIQREALEGGAISLGHTATRGQGQGRLLDGLP